MVDGAGHVRLAPADLNAMVLELDRIRLELKCKYAILDANHTMVSNSTLDHVARAIESLDRVVTKGLTHG